MKRTVLIFVLLMFLFGGCDQAIEETLVQLNTETPEPIITAVPPTGTSLPTETPLVPTAEVAYAETLGVTYLSTGDVELKLDIATPIDGEGLYPTIVFLFGGSWVMGSRHQYSDQIRLAAEKGYVGVTIDYQLNRMKDGKPTAPFPTQVHDANCAIQWLRSNAEDYKIDKDRIGVVGYSAGGHIALMVALTEPADFWDESCGELDTSSRIKAAVGLAPPIDLTGTYASPLSGVGVTEYLGGTAEEKHEVYLQASPFHYVSENDPPVLTIMGDSDLCIPKDQGELLDARMLEKGLIHELIVLEGKNHNNLSYGGEDIFDVVYAFLDQYLMDLE